MESLELTSPETSLYWKLPSCKHVEVDQRERHDRTLDAIFLQFSSLQQVGNDEGIEDVEDDGGISYISVCLLSIFDV